MAVLKGAFEELKLSLYDIMSWMLNCADMLHNHHINNCLTYAEHTLTQELYECLRDNADRLAEVSKALGILNVDCITEIDTLKDDQREFPIHAIGLARNFMQTIRDAWQSQPALISLVDDIDKELLQIKYKLEVEYGEVVGIIAKQKTRELRILK